MRERERGRKNEMKREKKQSFVSYKQIKTTEQPSFEILTTTNNKNNRSFFFLFEI